MSPISALFKDADCGIIHRCYGTYTEDLMAIRNSYYANKRAPVSIIQETMLSESFV